MKPRFRTAAEIRTWLFILLAVLFILSVSVIVVMGFVIRPQNGTVEMEVAKSALQVLVVTVIGGLVSLGSLEYQRRRQQEDKERDLLRIDLEYREDLLKSTLTRAMKGYTDVKVARRKFRALGRETRGDPGKVYVVAAEYDAHMEAINRAQIDFENLVRDVETSEHAFRRPADLVRSLKTIEDYLGDVIEEYEEQRPTFTERSAGTELSTLTSLKEFVGPSRGSKFVTRVWGPFHSVQRLLREDLLRPRPPDEPGAVAVGDGPAVTTGTAPRPSDSASS